MRPSCICKFTCIANGFNCPYWLFLMWIIWYEYHIYVYTRLSVVWEMYIILRIMTRRPLICTTDIFYHFNFSSTYIPDILLFIKQKFLANLNITIMHVLPYICTKDNQNKLSFPLQYPLHEWILIQSMISPRRWWFRHSCLTLKYFF